MTYNKTIWNTGDTITADKLNNIETGLFTLTDSYIANQAFPSDTYVDLPLGARPTLYEAQPINGFVTATGITTKDNQYISGGVLKEGANEISATTGLFSIDNWNPVAGNGTNVLFFVPKNHRFFIDSSIPELIKLRFVYAKGEVV